MKKEIKTKEYWNIFDNVKEVAIISGSRSKLKKNSRGAYRGAERNGWLDVLFGELKKKENGHWHDFDRVEKVAMIAGSRINMQKKFGGAYRGAERNGWLDVLFGELKTYPKGHWNNFNNVKEAAMIAGTRTIFNENFNGAYNSAKKHNWLDILFGESETKEFGHWNIQQNCLDVALLCETRSDFIFGYPGAYDAADRNGWLDKMYEHMIPIGSEYKRCVYTFEFDDNHIYDGLTYNLSKRENSHLTNKESAVFQHIEKTGAKYVLHQRTDYIDVEDAQKEELKAVTEHIKQGKIILNRARTGAIGGKSKYTMDGVVLSASQCKDTGEIRLKFPGEYNYASTKGILRELFDNMRAHRGSYNTKKQCRIAASQCISRSDFSKRFCTAYRNSKEWMDEFFPKYIITKKRKKIKTNDMKKYQKEYREKRKLSKNK